MVVIGANVVTLVMFIGASALQTPVFLGSAGNYVVLAKSGISTTGTTYIVGDIGVSPIAATGMTGFGLEGFGQDPNVTSPSSTSVLVAGNIYAADYGIPTPGDLTAAVLAMEAAYVDAATRDPPDNMDFMSGLIGGATLSPGLYRWGSTVDVASDLIFSGTSDDIWVLQIGGTLDVGTSARIILTGGCLPGNIFWQVQGQTTFEVGVVFQGILLGKTGIAMKSKASLTGRAFAQTAVTLIANSIQGSGTPPPTIELPTEPPTNAPPTSGRETPYEPPSWNASTLMPTASPTMTDTTTDTKTDAPTSTSPPLNTPQPTSQPTLGSAPSSQPQPTPHPTTPQPSKQPTSSPTLIPTTTVATSSSFPSISTPQPSAQSTTAQPTSPRPTILSADGKPASPVISADGDSSGAYCVGSEFVILGVTLCFVFNY